MGAPDDHQMTFGEHLDELRRRLWYAVLGVAVALGVTCWFADDLMRILQKPVVDALIEAKQDPMLIAINAMDPIMIYMKVTLIAAVFLASPWVAFQLWKFVSVGLLPNERRYVYVFGPATLVLFLAGTVFSYFVLVRFGLQFLVGFGATHGYRMMLEVNGQLMFVLMFSLVMGLVFELPLVMLLLVKIHIFTAKMYASKRRFFIIGAVVAAAIITPTTDPVNLTLAALPMLALFELGILLCRIAERGRGRTLAG